MFYAFLWDILIKILSFLGVIPRKILSAALFTKNKKCGIISYSKFPRHPERRAKPAVEGSRAGRWRGSTAVYYVYMLTNTNDRVLYIGVTNNLVRRVYEHKQEFVAGFTKQYHVHKLVYFEEYSDPTTAIAREKQLKGWTRAKKERLIDQNNPDWRDLFDNEFIETPW